MNFDYFILSQETPVPQLVCYIEDMVWGHAAAVLQDQIQHHGAVKVSDNPSAGNLFKDYGGEKLFTKTTSSQYDCAKHSVNMGKSYFVFDCDSYCLLWMITVSFLWTTAGLKKEFPQGDNKKYLMWTGVILLFCCSHELSESNRKCYFFSLAVFNLKICVRL